MDDDIELARRKERLIARIAAQRASLAAACRDLHGPIAVIDRTVAAVHFLRAHPLFVVALFVGVIVLRRRRIVGLLKGGVTAWRIWRSLAPWAGGALLAMRGYGRKS